MDGKEARLRAYLGDLKALKSLPPGEKELQTLAERRDLTGEDLNQIGRMADASVIRFRRHLEDQNWEEAEEEARQGQRLLPRDQDHLREYLEEILALSPADRRTLSETVKGLVAHLSQLPVTAEVKTWLKKNFANRAGGVWWKRPWALSLGVVILAAAVGLLTYFVVLPALLKPHAPVRPPVVRSQQIPLTFDGRGHPGDLQILRSELVSFEEKTYYQVAGRLVFSSEAVKELDAELLLADATGTELDQIPLHLVRRGDAPVPSGAGIEVSTQRDVTPFMEKVDQATLRLTTLTPANSTSPRQAQTDLEGQNRLPQGIKVELKSINDQWAEETTRINHRADFLLTCSGIRPLRTLTLEAWWTSPAGTELFRQEVPLIDPNRTPLSSGQSVSFRVSHDFSRQRWDLGQGVWPILHLSVKEAE